MLRKGNGLTFREENESAEWRRHLPMQRNLSGTAGNVNDCSSQSGFFETGIFIFISERMKNNGRTERDVSSFHRAEN